MKNITEIYNDYKIMPNLALHQMRVAAVAMQICDSLNMEVDKDDVISVCLFHDMGNIIKFDLSYFPNLNTEKGIEYWEEVKKYYINKYGENEHIASSTIAKELGLSDYVCVLIDKMISSSIKDIYEGDDLIRKICIYSDNRVAPYGVVSTEEHSLDAKERYKNHTHAFCEESRRSFMKYLYLIEKQIFSNSKIKPEDISNESIKDYLEKLKEFFI